MTAHGLYAPTHIQRAGRPPAATKVLHIRRRYGEARYGDAIAAVQRPTVRTVHEDRVGRSPGREIDQTEQFRVITYGRANDPIIHWKGREMTFTWGGLADDQVATDESRPPAHAISHHSTIEVIGYEVQAIGPSGIGDHKLISTVLTERFSGGIEGTGYADHLRVLNADGSGVLAGVERVIGSVAGRSGSFVLTSHASMVGGDTVSGVWTVVPESATDELAGLRGRGQFTARMSPDGKWHAEDTFTHWFEP